jgi:hypothetical protein
MDRQVLRKYLGQMFKSMLRYALYGALILGAISIAMQLGFIVLGQLPEVTMTSFLRASANWALIGGLFGAIVGLPHGLLANQG